MQHDTCPKGATFIEQAEHDHGTLGPRPPYPRQTTPPTKNRGWSPETRREAAAFLKELRRERDHLTKMARQCDRDQRGQYFVLGMFVAFCISFTLSVILLP